MLLWLDSSGTANLRAGIAGEALTIAELRPLLRRGWRLVNHVMLKHRDVDHVLIGPGGCFAIETKYRSRWPAWDRELGAWATSAAAAAHGVHNRTGQQVCVIPVVAMWGPHVREHAPEPTAWDGATLCAGRDLAAVIFGHEATLDPATVEDVYGKLDDYVRTRTDHEERDHGPRPRAVDAYALDVIFGICAGFGSLLALASVVRLGPAVVMYPLGCIALIASAMVVRHRWPHPRVRAVSAGVVAAAGAQLVIAAVLVVTVAFFGNWL